MFLLEIIDFFFLFILHVTPQETYNLTLTFSNISNKNFHSLNIHCLIVIIDQIKIRKRKTAISQFDTMIWTSSAWIHLGLESIPLQQGSLTI